MRGRWPTPWCPTSRWITARSRKCWRSPTSPSAWSACTSFCRAKWPWPRWKSASRTASRCRWSATSASTTLASSSRPSTRRWAARTIPRRKWTSWKRSSKAATCRRRPANAASPSCASCAACRPRPRNTPWCAITWTGCWICPGTTSKRSISTSKRPVPSSRAITSVWKSPRTASWNIWPCRSFPTACVVPSSASWARQAWARPRWPRAWPGPRDANTCAFPWAACVTRPRSAGTAVPMWAPCPARSSSP